MNRALPMGCSVSCVAFEAFSTFLEWALHRETGLDGLVHYLDDFLFIGTSGSGYCRVLLESFHAITEELSVPLAHMKTEERAGSSIFGVFNWIR